MTSVPLINKSDAPTTQPHHSPRGSFTVTVSKGMDRVKFPNEGTNILERKSGLKNLVLTDKYQRSDIHIDF